MPSSWNSKWPPNQYVFCTLINIYPRCILANHWPISQLARSLEGSKLQNYECFWCKSLKVHFILRLWSIVMCRHLCISKWPPKPNMYTTYILGCKHHIGNCNLRFDCIFTINHQIGHLSIIYSPLDDGLILHSHFEIQNGRHIREVLFWI